MATMRDVAVSTVVFDGHGFEEGLALLAACGVEEVEPAYILGYTPFSEETFTEAQGVALRGLLGAEGLRARAVSAHLDLGEDGADEALSRRLDFASALGAATLVTNATLAARAGRLERMLERILPRFEEARVTLALENPGHGAGALLPDGAAAARFVARVGHPRLAANYDVGNAVTYSGGTVDPVADLASVLPVATRIHLKDVAARGPDWAFCPLGEGMVGYDRVLASVAASALPPLAVEHPIRLSRPGRGDPVRMADRPAREAIAAAVGASLRYLADRLPARGEAG